MVDLGYSLSLVTAPTIEPVTVAELKTFARIDTTEEDDLIQEFITGARALAELYTRRAFIEQSWKLLIDSWNKDPFPLPMPQLMSFYEIYTLSDAGAETAFSLSNILTVTENEPGLIFTIAATPSSNRIAGRGIGIEFTCGYGDEAADVPVPIRHGIMRWAAQAYETRMLSAEPPPEVANLLRPYRILKA